MAKTFLTEDEINKMRKSYEIEDHWMLRRDFMLANRDDYSPERLKSLAQAFVNVEILQTTYPDEVMEEIKTAASRVVSLPEFRQNKEQLSLEDKFKPPPKKPKTQQLGTRNVAGHQYFNNNQQHQQQQHQGYRQNYNQGYQQNSYGYQQQQQYNSRPGEYKSSSASHAPHRTHPYQRQPQQHSNYASSYGYGNQQHPQQQQAYQHTGYARHDQYQHTAQHGYNQSAYGGGYQQQQPHQQQYNYNQPPRYGLQSSYAPRHNVADTQRYPARHQNANSGGNYRR